MMYLYPSMKWMKDMNITSEHFKWGFHTGTGMAMRLSTQYKSSRIFLIGFTFHSEHIQGGKVEDSYQHDPLLEKKMLSEHFNVTFIP